MRIKSFAINVAKNTYRRDHISGQSDKAGLDIRIFDAVTPQTLKDHTYSYNPERTRNFYGRPLFDTELACAMSHITLWEQLCQDHTADAYVIMEDDITITDNLARLINAVDWSKISFLKLSGQCKRPCRQITTIDDNYTLYKYAYGPLDAACYVITKYAAEKLLPYCRHLFAPIDIMIDRSYDHGVDLHGIMPYPTKTEFCFDPASPFYTDIGVRDDSYKKDRPMISRLYVRLHRLYGSLKRKRAEIALWCEDKCA